MDSVAIAQKVGSHPMLFLLLLVAVATFLVLALVFTVRWSDKHARAIWRRARKVWADIAMWPTMRSLEARIPWLWRAMRTLSATEYLLVHLALALGIGVAALLFVQLGQSVADDNAMVRVDVALSQALHQAASPFGVKLMEILTDFGGDIGVPILGVGVAIVLVRQRRRLLLTGWVVALVGVAVMNQALKGVFARARPVFEHPYSVGSGWSFPSGHSMATFVAAGMLAYLGVLFAKSAARQLLAVILAVAWSVAIGFSRMYLGVHYFSDVMAGFAAGTVWLGACITGIEIARRRPAVAPVLPVTAPAP